MRRGLLGSLSVLVTTTGMSVAQAPVFPGGVPDRLPAPFAVSASPTAEPPAADSKPADPEKPADPAKPKDAAKPAAQQQQQQKAADQNKPKLEDYRLCHQGPCEQIWFTGGVLLWQLRDGTVNNPILANAAGTPLIANNALDHDTFVGFSLGGGLWCDERHTHGVELGMFLLEQRTVSQSFASSRGGPADAVLAGSPGLNRPITDAVRGISVPFTVSAPGQIAGSLATTAKSQLGGGEANFLRNLKHNSSWNLDLLFGFRYIDLDERLDIEQNSSVVPGGNGGIVYNGQSVNSVRILDTFSTRNQFYGGQLGGRLDYNNGPWSLGGTFKLALGPNRELIETRGETSSPGLATTPSGLLAVQGTNAGTRQETWFVVAPEVGAQVGCQVSGHVRVTAGYSLLYLSDVVRPGSQIDVRVNPGRVPTSILAGGVTGPAQPRAIKEHDDFLAHGVQLGLEVRY